MPTSKGSLHNCENLFPFMRDSVDNLIQKVVLNGYEWSLSRLRAPPLDVDQTTPPRALPAQMEAFV